MALNIDSLFKPQWLYQSETAGAWNVYNYTVNAMIVVEKFFTEDSNIGATECVRELIGVMCTKGSWKEGQEPPKDDMTPEELATLTEEDIQSFARQFLEKDMTVTADADVPLTKNADQTDIDFLLETLNAENKRQAAKIGKVFEEMKPKFTDLFGSANLGIRNVAKDLEKQNDLMFQAYGSRGERLEMPALSPLNLEMPPHPAHETNNQLGDMNQRLDNLIGFGENALGIMHGLQGASAEFLEKFSTEAHNNSRAANKAIWVGVFAVLFAVAQIAYTEFWRVPQDTAAMDVAIVQMQTEIDELQSAVTASDEANAALLQGVQSLLQIQQELDSRVSVTLEAIAEALSSQSE